MKREDLEIGKYYLATDKESGVGRVFKFSGELSKYFNLQCSVINRFCGELHLYTTQDISEAATEQIKIYKEKVEKIVFLDYEDLEEGEYYVCSWRGGDIHIFTFSGPKSKYLRPMISESREVHQQVDLLDYSNNPHVLIRAATEQEIKDTDNRLETYKYNDLVVGQYYTEEMAKGIRVFVFVNATSTYLRIPYDTPQHSDSYVRLEWHADYNAKIQLATEEEIKSYDEFFQDKEPEKELDYEAMEVRLKKYIDKKMEDIWNQTIPPTDVMSITSEENEAMWGPSPIAGSFMSFYEAYNTAGLSQAETVKSPDYDPRDVAFVTENPIVGWESDSVGVINDRGDTWTPEAGWQACKTGRTSCESPAITEQTKPAKDVFVLDISYQISGDSFAGISSDLAQNHKITRYVSGPSLFLVKKSVFKKIKEWFFG